MGGMAPRRYFRVIHGVFTTIIIMVVMIVQISYMCYGHQVLQSEVLDMLARVIILNARSALWRTVVIWNNLYENALLDSKPCIQEHYMEIITATNHKIPEYAWIEVAIGNTTAVTALTFTHRDSTSLLMAAAATHNCIVMSVVKN